MLRSIEELDPFERLLLIDMSYSRLDTYKGCQAKYWYTYVGKAPRSFGPAAALGSAIHQVLEEMPLEDLTPEIMHELFHECLEIHDPDGEIDIELLEMGESMINEFYDMADEELANVVARERDFEYVLGTALFRGYIDRIDFLPEHGAPRVVDYKSGKHEISAKKAKDDLQLGLYALVAEKEFPDVYPIRAELFYLRSGRRPGHWYTYEDLREVERRIVEATNEMINKNQFDYTNESWRCKHMCDFGKQGVCPRGKGVIWKAEGGR